MRGVEYVSYQQVYDLVFRARNARLGSYVFVVDFFDWVKAGVAFNTRGCDISTRKISNFVKLYKAIKACDSEGSEAILREKQMFSDALLYYYEDIYSIYQDHLSSKQSDARTKNAKVLPDFKELLILPSFDGVPCLKDVFDVVQEVCETYEPRNEASFLADVKSVYLGEDTNLFKCMAMMYDYGIGRIGCDKLLEVSIWGKVM